MHRLGADPLMPAVLPAGHGTADRADTSANQRAGAGTDAGEGTKGSAPARAEEAARHGARARPLTAPSEAQYDRAA